MKKWIYCLCCLLVAAVLVIVIITQNKNSTIDNLNKDLFESRTKVNDLEERAAENEKKIQELDAQVEDLTAERDDLRAGRDQLAADNGRLTESLDAMNRNLSSSQEKLQGILYILTDGEQGTFEGLLSPFMKIFTDAGLESPYFAAVDHVTEHRLMAPMGEETFGVAEKATLGEFALGWAAIRNLPGGQPEAVAALLNAEKAMLSAQAPAEAPAAEETPAEKPAAEEAPAEEPAAEDENTVLTRERLLTLCKAVCYESNWEIPEIVLPESAETDANRGDLAIVLEALDQIGK